MHMLQYWVIWKNTNFGNNLDIIKTFCTFAVWHI
jgi:hypothetical protein